MYVATYDSPAGEVAQTTLELTGPSAIRPVERSMYRDLVRDLAGATVGGAVAVVARRLADRSDRAYLLLAAPAAEQLALRGLALRWHRLNEALAGVCRPMRDADEYGREIGSVAGPGIEIRNDPEERDGVVFHPSFRLFPRIGWLESLLSRRAESATVCWRFRAVDPRNSLGDIRRNLVRMNREWIPAIVRERQEELATRLQESSLLVEEFMILESRETQEWLLEELQKAFRADPSGQGFSHSPAVAADEIGVELLGPEGCLPLAEPPPLGNAGTVEELSTLLCDFPLRAEPLADTQPRGARPLKVFVSYSHKDRPYADRLRVSSAMLRKEGAIELWSDAELIPGDAWRDKINSALEGADVVLLLMSPDFLDSDFCYSVELGRALERHREGTAVVVPVFVRWSDVGSAPIKELQGLPSGLRPIANWPDQDEAWLDIMSGLRRVLRRTSAALTGTAGGRV